ncbi:MAG: sel1 repeat family protein [Gammaproteobacteria bacterium]|nr:sel1 repeat family protein [Gammaproteobacteria bacterium]
MNHVLLKSLLIAACLSLANGSHAGALEEGHAAFDAKHYQQAYTLWKPLAEQGNADAQYNLGLLYMNGHGVKKDDRMALMWFTRAGQQGLADAQYNAGVMFYLGKGVYPSYITAVKWWRLAAEKDHANAENNLAVMYAYGYGVEKNPDKAIELWTAAAEQGHPDAINALIEVYSGKMVGFKADPAKADFWKQKKMAR